ncbi:MAG: hypothetical protein P1U77_22695, partial [Rubripirellula sp.]|nr:hypothetical protein [Rubripirellula sp.]
RTVFPEISGNFAPWKSWETRAKKKRKVFQGLLLRFSQYESSTSCAHQIINEREQLLLGMADSERQTLAGCVIHSDCGAASC